MEIPLKLVPTHINYRFSTPACFFLKNPFYAAISLCECRARFHLHWFRRAVRNKKDTKILK